jgi:hypothetical protein
VEQRPQPQLRGGTFVSSATRGNSAIIEMEMTITNTGGSLSLNLFHYADIDLLDTGGDDSAAWSTPMIALDWPTEAT